MLIDITKIKLSINGVLHIGAYIGEEISVYEKLKIPNIIFFEPIKKHYEQLCANVKGKAQTFNIGLGNFNGTANIFVSESQYNGRPWFNCGSGASSSILEPYKHLIQHPNISFPNEELIIVRKLDDVILEYNINPLNYNFINIDVQGYELEVFKGAVDTLTHIDYIVAEVNRDELYKNCAKVEELDEFLGNFGFRRQQTNWAGDTWGDAFYEKFYNAV